MSSIKHNLKQRRHWLTKPISSIGIVLLSIGLGGLIAKTGAILTAILFVSVISFLFLIVVFRKPNIALKTAVIASFFVVGLTRYIPAPLGLSVDFLLVICWLVLILKGWKNANWKLMRHPLPILSVIWMIYVILELLNPETASIAAWFYSMRGLASYFFLTVPLVFLIFNRKKDMQWLLNTWMVLSLIAAAKGYVQLYIGLDGFEQEWMNSHGAETHLLFGYLRVFSFYSDAGQFGAAMAHAGLSALVLAMGPYRIWRKLGYIFVAVICLWAFMISGTRGAFAVLVGGGVCYLIITRHWVSIVLVIFVAIGSYYFLQNTYVGQSNYEIRRLRDAVKQGMDVPSFRIRRENQWKFRGYLRTRPFGGGVGSAGDWGKRFSPNTFLANTPTDSWYVRIWAETGIVGLLLYASIWLFVLIKGFIIIWNIKDPQLRNQLIAIYIGIVGILAASYGNAVVSQFPTALIVYLGICFVFMGEKWDKGDQYSPFFQESQRREIEHLLIPSKRTVSQNGKWRWWR